MSLSTPLRRTSFIALALAGLALAGCGSDDGGDAGPGLDPPGEGPTDGVPLLASDCDNIAPTFCGLPFPSNVYLQTDAQGKRSVRFGTTTLPKTFGNRPVPPELLHDKDGFSVGTGMMAHFPGVATDGMATPVSIEASLEADHPTVLLDTSTGERVPHWVDLDYSTDQDGVDGVPDERALIVRPAVRLKDDTRYIVAYRHLKHRDGTDIAPSQAFLELRDETRTEDYGVKRRRALYEDIFTQLGDAGVAREELQIAWDFTTATRANTTGYLVDARDAALAVVGADGPTYVVKSVQETGLPTGIKRRIVLTMTVPSYLTYHMGAYDEALVDAHEGKGPELVLDADGKPVQNGTMEHDVLIHVPDTIDDPSVKHGLLQNGHGLFGSKEEGQGGYLAQMAAEYGWIAFSVDLFGFSGDDVTMAINALSARPLYFKSFFSRQVQGQVIQLLTMRMMMGRVARDGIVDGSGAVLLPAASIDNTVRAYRGDSQGGIMGTTYMAASTDVTRGLLGEPGGPYSLLLNRSSDWPGYGIVLQGTYQNGLAVQMMIQLIQQGWDRSEPIGFVGAMEGDTLPGTPEHKVLIHPAIGDHQVTTFAAHLLARAVNAVNMRSDDGQLHRDVFGVPAQDGPITGKSVMVEYGFGLADEPLINKPALDGDDPHDTVRVLTPSYEQQDHFFRTGEVIWTCEGLCNCDGPSPEAGCPAP